MIKAKLDNAVNKEEYETEVKWNCDKKKSWKALVAQSNLVL